MQDKHQNGIPGYLVVIGASAGGLNSVIELVAQFKPEMNIAVCIVMHISSISATDSLIGRIQRHTSLNCKMAENEEPLRRNHLYFGQPDKHLIVKKDQLLLGEGPGENRWRPSIDVMFRSAAVAFDGRTIGVILSGLMQDGMAGMVAIKRCGGACIVQDPDQAEYAEMPLSVLRNIEVDFCAPLERIGEFIVEKTREDAPVMNKLIPIDLQAEADIAERVAIGMNRVREVGKRSDYTCPDCGGSLWEMVNDSVVRYRCFTGHVFNENELLIRQTESVENTMWIALRMIEERKDLLLKMAEEEETKGWIRSAGFRKQRADELQSHIRQLKEILFGLKKAEDLRLAEEH